jgi:hypothetical protein
MSCKTADSNTPLKAPENLAVAAVADRIEVALVRHGRLLAETGAAGDLRRCEASLRRWRDTACALDDANILAASFGPT